MGGGESTSVMVVEVLVGMVVGDALGVRAPGCGSMCNVQWLSGTTLGYVV